jgi:hypothetical protein
MRWQSSATGMFRVCTVSFLGVLLAGSEARAVHFDRQSLPAHSSIVSKADPDVRDDAFAKLMKGLLDPAIHHATFLFNTCFGGGMLDDLERELGNVKWVGGSAARHDQQAWGPRKGIEFWTRPLLIALSIKKSETFIAAIRQAAARDTERAFETGQGIDNGGGEHTLRERGVTSHHAILWGGQGEIDDMDSIRAVRRQLLDAWGPVNPPQVTIDVLFFNGSTTTMGRRLPREWQARPATLTELKKVIKELSPLKSSDEEFFFYAADHGNLELGIALEKPRIPSDAKHFEWGTLKVPPTVLEALSRDRENKPFITVKYSSVVKARKVKITLNEVFYTSTGQRKLRESDVLGFLHAGENETSFRISEEALRQRNALTADADNSNHIVIESAEFNAGGIDLAGSE